MSCKGIYKIINVINGKYYIGSDSNISSNTRWSDHKGKLRRGIHYNPHLQRAWIKYGKPSFEYKVIETFDGISAEELSGIEQKHLNEAKKEKNKCYNVVFGVRNYKRISGGKHGLGGRKKIYKTDKQKKEVKKRWNHEYYMRNKERIDERAKERYWEKQRLLRVSSD